MTHTKETIVIDNPSKELLCKLKEMKERKRTRVDCMRKMNPEDFSCRIYL